MQKFTSRILSVYERNQLLKYSLKEAELLTKSELPVEYFTGFVNFKNLDLKVNQNVLIPRVETEELVDLLINFAISIYTPFSCLEVGTGSGAISAAFFDFLLKTKKIEFEELMITDISNEALNLAKENFTLLFGAAALSKIRFLRNDLLDNFPKKSFNIIVANLPYIPSAKIAGLDASVKDHEPLLALDGGKTGFELINKMLEQVLNQDLLVQDGKIFLEVYETHNVRFIEKRFRKIYEKFSIEEIKDQFERQRFLVLQKI